jgi:hypothetical protein
MATNRMRRHRDRKRRNVVVSDHVEVDPGFIESAIVAGELPEASAWDPKVLAALLTRVCEAYRFSERPSFFGDGVTHKGAHISEDEIDNTREDDRFVAGSKSRSGVA